MVIGFGLRFSVGSGRRGNTLGWNHRHECLFVRNNVPMLHGDSGYDKCIRGKLAK